MSLDVNETCPQAVSAVTFITNPIEGYTPFCQVIAPAADHKTITIPTTPIPLAGTLQVSKNGQVLTPAVDYVAVEHTILLTVAALSTDTFLVQCQLEA